MATDILNRIVKRLLRDAQAHPGVRQKAPKLKRGLFIELYITKAHELHLLLYRENKVAPAEHEWNTVLRAFPPDFPAPTPLPKANPFTERGKHCLSAHWIVERPKPFEKEQPHASDTPPATNAPQPSAA